MLDPHFIATSPPCGACVGSARGSICPAVMTVCLLARRESMMVSFRVVSYGTWKTWTFHVFDVKLLGVHLSVHGPPRVRDKAADNLQFYIPDGSLLSDTSKGRVLSGGSQHALHNGGVEL